MSHKLKSDINSEISMIPTNIKLSDKQKLAFSMMKKGENIFLTGVAGSGKCLAKDTPVIMFTGDVKIVQDIKEGELIMGDDSTFRTVLSTTTGEDEMYKIKTYRGDSYTVNSEHILTFHIRKNLSYNNKKHVYILKWGDKSGVIKYKCFNTRKEAIIYIHSIPSIIDIPIMKCLNKSIAWNSYFKGVYKKLSFPSKNVFIDPYIIGLYLGNQKTSDYTICVTDKEVVNYLSTLYSQNNMLFSRQETKINDITTITTINLSFFCKYLESYGVTGNKHIPADYKYNSQNNRLKLLAGIIDIDGYLNKNSYKIIQKNKTLANDIYFVAKSLGFHAKVSEKLFNNNATSEIVSFYIIQIIGDMYKIPVISERKKARKHKKYSPFSKVKITRVGKGQYYGFELDKNHRFVLGNFLVTHNTSCVKLFINTFKNERIMGVTSTTGISALLFGGTTVHSYLGIGLGNGSSSELISKILKRSYLKNRWKNLETLIIDEVSMLSPVLFDKLEEIARTIRFNNKPFGGIQLILSGDFCFSGDTKILMYNREVKLAKDILPNDIILGDDNLPRTVYNLFQGTSVMYKISFPDYKEELIVTGNHIMCLKYLPQSKIHWIERYKCWVVYSWNNNKISMKPFYNYNSALSYAEYAYYNDVSEMTVNEFLKLPTELQKDFASYKIYPKEYPEIYYEEYPEIYAGICFEERSKICNEQTKLSLINPYFLGLWLSYIDINTFDNSIRKFIDSLKYLKHNIPDDFDTQIGEYEIIYGNIIPDIYINSSPKNRLKLLTGLLEYNKCIVDNLLIKACFKCIDLIQQVFILAKSLGLKCKMLYTKDINNLVLYECHISGNISIIPFKNTTENSDGVLLKNTKQNINTAPSKNTLSDFDNDVVYNDSIMLMRMVITKEKYDNFYGFEIDGNKRFLLDTFTVVHNCQLPCVKSDNFCFESESWDKCIPKKNVVYLDEIMRQENEEFQKCLNNVRMGLLPKETRKILESRVGAELKNDFGIKPTRLFSTNYSVDLINEEELDILAETGVQFYEYAMNVYVYPEVKEREYTIEKYKKNCNAQEVIQLCVGAQVMLLYNMDLDNGLVNGSRGVVSSFISDIPVVKFLNGREVIVDYHTWEVEEQGNKILKAVQIPLKLAYACTIHKQQGATLDYAQIDLSNLFEYGMAYVALSRTKNLEGLSIINIDYEKINAHPKALKFYEDLNKK